MMRMLIYTPQQEKLNKTTHILGYLMCVFSVFFPSLDSTDVFMHLETIQSCTLFILHAKYFYHIHTVLFLSPSNADAFSSCSPLFV